jgi:ribosomal protein S4E
MANKGHSNRQKRMSYTGRVQIKRKEHVWTFNQAAGAHAKTTGATLGSIIRDVLKFVDNTREIKYLMQIKTVLVNGRRVKDYHFSIGLFDVLEFKEIEKRYRVFLTHNNKFTLKEMGKTERLLRPCRIVKKTVLGNDKVQIGFENGFTLLEKKSTKMKVGDCVEFDVVKQKFGDTIVLKENARVYIVGGPHVSKIGTLKNVVKGDVKKANEVTVESDGKMFKTMEKYVFAIPEDIKL